MIELIEVILAGDFRNEWSKDKKQEVLSWLIKNNFNEGYPDELSDYFLQSYNKRIIINSKQNQDKGYVLWMNNPQTKDYVGGFSLEIFFEEYLISYIERGLVHGYIGHSARKVWVDKLMEKICLPKIKGDDFANWLTSTAGRHFMDQIENMIENENHSGVEQFIKNNLAKIHDQAVIFNYPGHEGSWKSSLELFDKLKSAGLMMLDTYEYGW